MRNMFIFLLLMLPLVAVIIRLTVLLFRALRKYLSDKPKRQESDVIKKSLGEVLKDHRMRCSMTQEFVAEAMGVSRQAVSKWENGTSDPPLQIC